MSVDPKATNAKLAQQVAVKGKDGTKKRYKIVYDREACIGAAACVAAYPERWAIVDDGKADITGEDVAAYPERWAIVDDGKADITGDDVARNDDNTEQTVEITEEEFQKMMDAAQACPVTVIHIIDLETDERVI